MGVPQRYSTIFGGITTNLSKSLRPKIETRRAERASTLAEGRESMQGGI